MRTLRQEHYFPLIVAVHFGLWAIDLSLYTGSFHDADADTFFGGFSTKPGQLHPLRVLGEMFSSWVVTVFAFNFLMATRARWVERVFGGLDKMYLIHRRSGVIAVVLLLAHFVVVPRDLTAFTVGKPLGFFALALILLGVVLSAAPPLKSRIPYQRWLPLHRLMGLFYVMGLAHASMVHSLIWELPLTRVYVFGMSAVGVSAWLYRAVFYRFVSPAVPHTVVSAGDAGGGVLDLRLSPSGAGSLEFEPGQFAFLRLPGVSSEAHPFTMASSPGQDLRFLVKGLGDFTRALPAAVQAGAHAIVEGPFGHFTLRHTAHPRQVWVAGGIGITPFLSLVPAATDLDVTLIWCVSDPSEAFRLDALRSAAANAGVAFTLWSSAERGYLSVAGIADVRGTDDLADTSVLICGPPGLKDALRGQLRAAGVRSADLHDEAFAFR